MQLRTIFKKMDKSGDGELDSKEFTKFLHKVSVTGREGGVVLFSRYFSLTDFSDPARYSHLTFAFCLPNISLKLKVGVKLKQQAYVKLMKCLDASGDGSISYKEFQSFVRVFQAEEDEELEKWKEKKREADEAVAQMKHPKAKSKGAAEEEQHKSSKKGAVASSSDQNAGLEKLWAKIGKYIDKKGGTDGVSMFKAMFEKYDTNGMFDILNIFVNILCVKHTTLIHIYVQAMASSR
jgi:hypothetical protein